MSIYDSQELPQLSKRINFGWIGEAFQLFLAQAGNWIGAVFITFVIILVTMVSCEFLFGVFPALAADATGRPDPFLIYRIPGYWGTVAVVIVVEMYLYAGLFKMANAQVRGLPISIGMLFQGGRVALPLLACGFLSGIAVTAGLVALVFGAFVCIALLAPAYALIADGVPLAQALNRSVEAVKRDWFQAGVFALVLYLLSILGIVLTCGIGVLVVLPMWLLILSLVYRDMIGMPGVAMGPDSGFYGAAQPGVWPPPPGAPYPAQNPNPLNPSDAGYSSQWPPVSTQTPQSDAKTAATDLPDSAESDQEQSGGTPDRPE